MKTFKTLRLYLEKIGFFIGNFITTIVMIIFYFTVFAIFAIPFRFFSKDVNLKPEKSSWVKKESSPDSLEYFKAE